mgnify:CR=1 FL=1
MPSGLRAVAMTELSNFGVSSNARELEHEATLIRQPEPILALLLAAPEPCREFVAATYRTFLLIASGPRNLSWIQNALLPSRPTTISLPGFLSMRRLSWARLFPPVDLERKSCLCIILLDAMIHIVQMTRTDFMIPPFILRQSLFLLFDIPFSFHGFTSFSKEFEATV